MGQLSTRIGTILGGVASGLIRMSIFASFYAVWAIFAWPIPGAAFFTAALALSAFLAFRTGTLLRRVRTLPPEINAYDARIS